MRLSSNPPLALSLAYALALDLALPKKSGCSLFGTNCPLSDEDDVSDVPGEPSPGEPSPSCRSALVLSRTVSTAIMYLASSSSNSSLRRVAIRVRVKIRVGQRDEKGGIVVARNGLEYIRKRTERRGTGRERR